LFAAGEEVMQGKSKFIKYINCPVLLVWRVFTFICSFLLSCAAAVFFLAFRILKAFLSTYADPLPEENRRKKSATKYCIDEKGSLLIKTDNMSDQYPTM
jgi:hypothetical protein